MTGECSSARRDPCATDTQPSPACPSHRSRRPDLSQPPSSGGSTMLPLSRIIPGYNPRRYFDRRKHDELVASLRLRGML